RLDIRTGTAPSELYRPPSGTGPRKGSVRHSTRPTIAPSRRTVVVRSEVGEKRARKVGPPPLLHRPTARDVGARPAGPGRRRLAAPGVPQAARVRAPAPIRRAGRRALRAGNRVRTGPSCPRSTASG